MRISDLLPPGFVAILLLSLNIKKPLRGRMVGVAISLAAVFIPTCPTGLRPLYE